MLAIALIPVLTDNYIPLIHDPVSGETAVVDPALAQPVLDELVARGWTLTYIFNTHHHWDHVDGNCELKEKTGCQVIGSGYDQHRIPAIDLAVDENSQLSLGEHPIQVIETPGHTSGHVVYYFAEDSVLFCGDTLFSLGCGRLFEGTARQMWQSLQKLKVLPPETQIYCAHEYTLANAEFALSIEPDNKDLQQAFKQIQHLRKLSKPTLPSTIARELACNPFLREDSVAIQKNIGCKGKSGVAIFTEIRRLKDNF